MKDIKNKPYIGNKPFIFISYSHQNTSEVLEVIKYMQINRYRIWWDEGIRTGVDYKEEIAKKINECEIFISFVSKEFIESKSSYFKNELSYAKELNKKIIMVYLQNVELPQGVKMEVHRLQAIHKYKFNLEHQFYEKLFCADGLQKCIDLTCFIWKYVKYSYKTEWEYDEDWRDDKLSVSDTCKLYAKRTLYHGQRKFIEEQVVYKHKKVDENGHENIIWTGSKTPPKSYEYEKESQTQKIIKYENIGKWVTSETKLGAYTYNITTREQYKYRRMVSKKYIIDVKWSSEEEAPEGYEKL